MKKKFYVTTPIYYVNDEPHIGHAYTTILADVIARYHSLFGEDVFFLTGTDEHGQKLQEAADKAGVDPKTLCDQVSKRFNDVWKKLNINYSRFIRTTEEEHEAVVQELLDILYKQGDIYKDSYNGWYCVPDERFYTEKDLADGKCPDCGREVVEITEENYFFRMSKYQDWLVDYIKSNPDFIQPESRANEILGFLKRPLNDLCISRPKSRLSWGVELPFDKDFVSYVWVDALINYLTGIKYRRDDEIFNKYWPADYHLIGKDILTTHAVYWPTILKALNIPMPKTILAHGWWVIEGTKMSKSLGNVVKPLDLSDKYGVDAFRYFLIKEMTLGLDSSFSEEKFVLRYNSDLANDYGNLCNRVFKMVRKYSKDSNKISSEKTNCLLLENALSLKAKSDLYLKDLKMNLLLEEIMQFIRSINRYLEQEQPWKLFKNDYAKTISVLSNALEAIRIASVYLSPVMPEKTAKVLNTLGGFKAELTGMDWREKLDFEIGDFEALFPRVDVKELEKELESSEESKVEEGIAYISFNDFMKTDLRVAQIKKIEEIKKADKLYKLTIDVGNKKKTLAAGIKKFYKPEELEDKKIVIVNNLEPRKIMGVLSEGMLLAAKKKGKLTLITVDKDIENGSEIN